jgi:hypothetical protein
MHWYRLCLFWICLPHGCYLFHEGCLTIKWLYNCPSCDAQFNNAHFNTVQ